MKTIAWDIDDVLNECMRTWLERHWRPAHPGCTVEYDDIVKNPPYEIVGCTEAEYKASLDEFRQSPAAREMQPNPQVLAWFVEHGQAARHVAVTAAPISAAHLSAAWVLRHFGRWIRTFHVVPSFREGENLPVYDRSKGEALQQWRNIDAFIDDDPPNIASAKNAGIKTFCFPRPWNRTPGGVAELLNTLTKL